MKRIVILLIVITGIYIIYNQAINFDWGGDGSKNTKTVATNQTEMMILDLSSGSTRIIPEDRKDLKVVYSGKEKLTVEEVGNTIVVSVTHRWYDWVSFSKHNDLKIYIPKNYDRKMTIILGSGNVNFAGPTKDNPSRLDELTVTIGSGNMNLKNLEIKSFIHNEGSGNVKIDTLKTKTGSIDLSSGNLNIKHYTGSIDAKVTSGKLDLQMDKLTDSINIDLTSGLVNLDVPNNSNFTLNGHVSSGKISSRLPLTTKETGSKNINGKHGTGKYRIDLSVSSGVATIH